MWNKKQFVGKESDITKDALKNAVMPLLHIGEHTFLKCCKILHRRKNIICSTNCKYRTAGTLYTLETWDCFWYITVNTLHKGDKDDDDDDDNNSFVCLHDMHQQMIKTSHKGKKFCFKCFFSISLLQQDSACV